MVTPVNKKKSTGYTKQDDGKQYALYGKFYWTKVFKPDEKYNKYSVDFVPMDDRSKTLLEAWGLTEQEPTATISEGFYRLRMSAVTKAGEPQSPEVIDSEGVEWNPRILIGNGSVGYVKVWVKASTATDNGFIVVLKKLQVDELVKYDAGKTNKLFEKAIPRDKSNDPPPDEDEEDRSTSEEDEEAPVAVRKPVVTIPVKKTTKTAPKFEVDDDIPF